MSTTQPSDQSAAHSVLLDRSGPVITVTLNRPGSMNAITGEMCESLRSFADEIATDADARVIVLQGAGKCFSVGGDVGAFAKNLDNMRPLIRQMIPDINAFILALRRMDKVVVANVHGMAAGGGLSLALACDLVVAGAKTQFAFGYRNLGTTPDAGGTCFLTRAVGEKKAFELLLHRHIFSAAEAAQMGLINWAVPEDEQAAHLGELCASLSRLSRNAVLNTKRLINLSYTSTLEQQLSEEVESFVQCSTRPDFTEGIRAFLDKRAPNFKD